jgi:hypothetical protein
MRRPRAARTDRKARSHQIRRSGGDRGISICSMWNGDRARMPRALEFRASSTYIESIMVTLRDLLLLIEAFRLPSN